MKSIRNLHGKMTKNEVNDLCPICDRPHWVHTTKEVNDCKRALANSV